MPTYSIRAARANLAKLVACAEAGEDVVLVRGKTPVAKNVPVIPKPKRKFGRLKDKASIGPEFFEPLPEEELKWWE